MAAKKDSSGDVEKGSSTGGTMSWIAGMCVIAGCMIGVGVFVTGGSIFTSVKNPFIAIGLWVTGGIIAICGGLTWAEWALMIPKSGGDIPYLEHAFPKIRRFLSFQFLFCRSIFSHPIVLALLSFICTYFLITIFASDDYSYSVKYHMLMTSRDHLEAPAPKHEGGIMMKLIYLGIGYFLMAAAFCLVAFSDVIIIKSATVLTLLKMVIILFLISCGFKTFMPSYRSPDFKNSWTEAIESFKDGKDDFFPEGSLKNIANGLLTVFFAYDGFANLSAVITDLRNPRRDTLKAIIAGVVIVSILYTGINVFYFFGLTSQEVKDGGFNLAANYVSVILFGDDKYYRSIMTTITICCIFVSGFGALLGISFAAARITYVSGTLGNYLPLSRFLGTKHSLFGTPFNATLLQFGMSIPILAVSIVPAVNNALFNAAMYCNWIFYTITAAALIYVRFRDPHAERPFRVFLLCPILVCLVGAFMLVFPWIPMPDSKDTRSYFEKVLAPFVGVVAFTLGAIVWYFNIYRKETKML